MVYVFDSSFIAALIIPDEKTQNTDKMYDSIENADEKYAPHLVWYEMSNIFMNLIRSKRYLPKEVMQFFPLLAAMRLIDDFESGIDYSTKLLRLCNDYNLSSYDAAYMELAGRKNAVLCTLDTDLRITSQKYGVAVL